MNHKDMGLSYFKTKEKKKGTLFGPEEEKSSAEIEKKK